MEDSPDLKFDNLVFDAAPLSEAEDPDKAYWLSKTPKERLQALELMRRLEYGDDATARIDKTKFDVVQFKDLE
jgi:hypothetical protein